MTKPSVLVTRAVFPEVIDRLAQYFDVDDNQPDVALDGAALKARLEADPAPRWIVVKDKMDHGPFAAIELLQQIVSNSFKPKDLLVDTHTLSRIV